jgi:hypothetical protein
LRFEYSRLYADESGESHFSEPEAELSEVEFALTTPPVFLSESTAVNHYQFFAAPAGWQAGWHVSPARHLFVAISGEWEVTASDGETRKFGPTAVLLVDDTSGKGHTSRVLGNSDSTALLIELP